MAIGRRWSSRGARGRWRRVLATQSVWCLVVGAFAVVTVRDAGRPAEDAPGWVDELASGDVEAVESIPWEEPARASLPEVRPARPLDEATFPEAGSWEVALAGEGEAGELSGGDEGPVEVRAGGPGLDGEELRVEVFDRDVAEQVGASGFVFEVADAGRARPTSRTADVAGDGGRAGPMELAVDYSGFAEAYGAGYADRLKAVAVPDCALEDARSDRCPTAGWDLPVRNDTAARTLHVEVDDLAALAALAGQAGEGDEADGRAGPTAPAGSTGDRSGQRAELQQQSGGSGVTLAVTSDVSSEVGAFDATPISPTGQWQASTGSGELAYSYPIDVPAPAGGTAPPVSLSYSSGAVDGLTNATNTQATAVGVGWSQFTNAFIERRYEPCIDADTLPSPDLCWMGQNGTISLEGASGALVPTNAEATEWRVSSDAGWKVERLTGADNVDSGDAVDGAGEHWKVTATDGTQYFFGLGENPDTGADTQSVAMVPVFGDHVGDPCHGGPIGACNQAWRWSLDRVVDPDGNVTTYYYDRGNNNYAAGNTLYNPLPYHSAIAVKRIEYGARAGSGQPTMRVVYGRPYRCTYLSDWQEEGPDRTCPLPRSSNSELFPDVPVDLICRSGPCTATAPSFFMTTRYSFVRTEVLVNGDWRGVKQYNLYHSLSSGPSDQQKLYLQQIGEVGLNDPDEPLGLLPLPATEFNYEWLPNRVDVDESTGRKPMEHARIDEIVNPMGGRTNVTYGQNRECEPGYNLPRWNENARDCFPQTMYDADRRRIGLFNKYLVMTVTDDAGFLTDPVTTSYEYEDDPAWAFNYGSFAQYAHRWGWSGWRGYGTTTVTQGDSVSSVRVFRGLHGDPTWVEESSCPCGSRAADVESLTDLSLSVPDLPSLMGRTFEEASYGEIDGAPDQILQSTRYSYEQVLTHDAPPGFRDAVWAGVTGVTENVATAPGQYRQRGGTTTYEAWPVPSVPRAVSSLEEGWFDVTGDERCSRTTYADNPDAWMFAYPASNVVVAGDCDSTTELSVSETYYDGSTTLGAPPSRGSPTRERTKLDSATWAETTTTFDDLGRPVSVTDPNGATTTTGYEVPSGSPAHGLPTETTVTNELGHTHTTVWSRLRQAPRRETDANGNLTTYAYDGLGRLVAVRLPTEQPYEQGKEPSWRFSYSEDQKVVRSRQLTSEATSGPGVRFEDAWVIYDGLGRQWQTQQQSPGSGKVLVSTTVYDDRGLVGSQIDMQAFDGTPGSLVVVPQPDNSTRYTYDELGRPVREERLRGGTVTHTTETAYAVDTVTVTGPDGGRVRETVDGLGRTVEVAEHDGTDWVASSYGYDLSGNLVSVSDPAGNQATYTYDLAGRRLTQDDPDRGTASFGYDPAGNQTSVTDGEGNAIHTVYDPLGRAVERRAGSAGGQPLVSWDYDAPGELGLLDRETRHTAEGDWVSDVTGYDARGRSLGATATVPAGIPGLSGSYTTSQTYDRADRVTSTTYPAVAGLPEETVTTTYDGLGLPAAMTGLEPYVRSTTYDDRGRLTGAAFGPENPGGGVWMARSWAYDADQRLASTEAYVAGSAQPDGVVSRHELGHDDVGNVAEITTILDGSSWRECFQHDERQRLVWAFTVDTSSTCAEGQKGTGDQPYEHRFIYSPDGNLVARSEVIDPTWEDALLYGYPPSGQDRPHAPTTVGTDTYTWDGNGNLAERTVEGATETFSWDVEQQLASVTATEGTTSFVYDAGGQRMLRRTDDGATLYVAGHEITTSTDGSTVTAVRSYSFEGQLVATRTSAGVEYMLTDVAGSVEMAVRSGGQPTASRTYEPYGQVRTENGEMETDQGFVGQIEDSTTRLSYMNARYYDPETGVFVSPDPLYDTGDIKSLSPHTYAAGNPATFSDPSGLSASYISGLEMQNHALRGTISQLQGHIKRLGGHIEDLQGIIKKQRRAINKLLTHISTLESIIRQQQSVIRRLVARVNYLIGVVNYQRAVIGRLQAKIAHQQRIINAQAATIHYYKGVVNQLVDYTWAGKGYGPIRSAIKDSIHSGAGIPSWSWGSSKVARLQGRVTTLEGEVKSQRDAVHAAELAYFAVDWERDMLRGKVDGLEGQVEELEKKLEAGGYSGNDAYCDAVTIYGTVTTFVDSRIPWEPTGVSETIFDRVHEIGLAADFAPHAANLVPGVDGLQGCTTGAAQRLAGYLSGG